MGPKKKRKRAKKGLPKCVIRRLREKADADWKCFTDPKRKHEMEEFFESVREKTNAKVGEMKHFINYQRTHFTAQGHHDPPVIQGRDAGGKYTSERKLLHPPKVVKDIVTKKVGMQLFKLKHMVGKLMNGFSDNEENSAGKLQWIEVHEDNEAMSGTTTGYCWLPSGQDPVKNPNAYRKGIPYTKKHHAIISLVREETIKALSEMTGVPADEIKNKRVFINRYPPGEVSGTNVHQDKEVAVGTAVIKLSGEEEDPQQAFRFHTSKNDAGTPLPLAQFSAAIFLPGVWHSVPCVARSHERVTLNLFF